MSENEIKHAKEFTEAVGREVPECWDFVMTRRDDDMTVWWLTPREICPETDRFIPTLSQLKQYMEWMGWKQRSGTHPVLDGQYICSLQPKPRQPYREFIGDTEPEAALKAATDVARRGNNASNKR